MGRPTPLYFFMALDTAALLFAAFMGATILGIGGFPFNVIMGALVLLIFVQSGFMLYSCFCPSEVGYYDHLFWYVPLILFFGKSHPVIFTPVLALLLILLFRPRVREFFRLPVRFPAVFIHSEAVLMFPVLVLAILAHAVTNEGFPIMKATVANIGVLHLYVEKTYWIFLGVIGAVISWGLLKSWKIAYFLAPLAVVVLLLPHFSTGLLVGSLYLIVWMFPENRVRFGLSGDLFRGLWGVGVWGLLAGTVFALIPIGTCDRHAQALYLFPAWKTPQIVNAHKDEVIYKLSRSSITNRVQAGCPRCEMAIIYRNERAACRQAMVGVRDQLQALFPGPMVASGPRKISWNGTRLEIDSAEPEMQSRVRELFEKSLRFPCPGEEKIGTGTASVREYRFTLDETGQYEIFCGYCAQYE